MYNVFGHKPTLFLSFFLEWHCDQIHYIYMYVCIMSLVARQLFFLSFFKLNIHILLTFIIRLLYLLLLYILLLLFISHYYYIFYVGLNGRPLQMFISPQVALLAKSFTRYSWYRSFYSSVLTLAILRVGWSTCGTLWLSFQCEFNGGWSLLIAGPQDVLPSSKDYIDYHFILVHNTFFGLFLELEDQPWTLFNCFIKANQMMLEVFWFLVHKMSNQDTKMSDPINRIVKLK